MPVMASRMIPTMWMPWIHLGVAGARWSCSGQWPSRNDLRKRLFSLPLGNLKKLSEKWKTTKAIAAIQTQKNTMSSHTLTWTRVVLMQSPPVVGEPSTARRQACISTYRGRSLRVGAEWTGQSPADGAVAGGPAPRARGTNGP